DPSTGMGAVVGHLPVSLSDLSAVSIGDTVYLVGGYDGSVPRPEVYATRDGVHFAQVATLPLGLRYPAVTVADGRLIVAGGQGVHGPTRSIFAVDPASGVVRRLGTLPAGVAH